MFPYFEQCCLSFSEEILPCMSILERNFIRHVYYFHIHNTTESRMRAMRSLIVLCGKYEVDSTLLCSDAVALGLGTGATQRLCETRSLT